MSEQAPPAGWYPDPSQPQTQRYWTGSEWTEQRAPMEQTKTNSGDFTVGIVLAILIPIVGLIMGIVMQSKGDKNGVTVIVVSLVLMLVYIALFAALTSSPTGRLG